MAWKRIKPGMAFLLILATCQTALAFPGYGAGIRINGNPRTSLYIGTSLFPSDFYGFSGHRFGYYPFPPMYSPLMLTRPLAVSAPVTYIEKPEQPAEGYWYYCFEPAGYYPQVANCLGNWQKIPPQLPPN